KQERRSRGQTGGGGLAKREHRRDARPHPAKQVVGPADKPGETAGRDPIGDQTGDRHAHDVGPIPRRESAPWRSRRHGQLPATPAPTIFVGSTTSSKRFSSM